jgi:hypothetical protein
LSRKCKKKKKLKCIERRKAEVYRNCTVLWMSDHFLFFLRGKSGLMGNMKNAGGGGRMNPQQAARMAANNPMGMGGMNMGALQGMMGQMMGGAGGAGGLGALAGLAGGAGGAGGGGMPNMNDLMSMMGQMMGGGGGGGPAGHPRRRG